MLGPSLGHVASSLTALLLLEKLGIDVLLPFWMPATEAFFNEHSRPMALLISGVAVTGISFWGLGTLMTLPAIYDVKMWKIQTNRTLNRRMLLDSLPLIVFNYLLGLVVAPVMAVLLPDSSFSFSSLPSTGQLGRDILIWLAAEEVSFFYLHRWMHLSKYMYQTVHKVHHKWHAPVALVAIYCHPLEHLLCNIFPLLLGPVLCGSHIVAIAIYFVAGFAHTTAVHSGYWFCDDNGIHDEHHAKLIVNFGVMGVMDYLYGTYRLPAGAAVDVGSSENTTKVSSD